jgi:hypothetical protein
VSISEDLFSSYQKSCSAIEQDALFKPILQSRFLDGFSALMFTGVIGTLQARHARSERRGNTNGCNLIAQANV